MAEATATATTDAGGLDPFGWLSGVTGIPIEGSGEIRVGTPQTGFQVTWGAPRYTLTQVLLFAAVLYLFSRGR